ncbi:hypothetical protein H5U35_09320 [Candidatus Aerophobetes bacterium]|nr:hypothetical protein [Candidatus Aerophobetes bacterium]
MIEQKKEEKKEEKKPLPVVINSEFKLIGIVWQKTGAVAFIAGRGKTWVVEEGTTVDGFKVARIEGEKGEVTLLGEDKIIKLKMLKL